MAKTPWHTELWVGEQGGEPLTVDVDGVSVGRQTQMRPFFCNKRLCHHARKDFNAINGDLPDNHVVFKRETESMANDFHAPINLLKSKSAK